MHSGKQPVNCVPCAKRKVRCDKRQPCGHCKRREEDVCVYPLQRANRAASRPDDYSQRIEKLETYIRRLGGDPQLTEQILESGEVNGKDPSTCSPTNVGDTDSSFRPKENIPPTTSTKGLIGRLPGLVELDEQVTYIQAYVIPRAFACSG